MIQTEMGTFTPEFPRFKKKIKNLVGNIANFTDDSGNA